MAALFDFLKKALDGIGGADIPPVILRELIKGQTVIQVAVQTVTGAGVDGFIFEQKSGGGLLGLFKAFLIENGAQLWLDLVVLFFGNVA